MAVADASRKVLVVEPDAATRREIKQVCEQDGYQVVEADAGSEALRQIESSRPSVILLEVTLPDAAGFDVCRELRRMDPAVPVIMMSSRSDEIDAVVALEIGADDYVTRSSTSTNAGPTSQTKRSSSRTPSSTCSHSSPATQARC